MVLIWTSEGLAAYLPFRTMNSGKKKKIFKEKLKDNSSFPSLKFSASVHFMHSVHKPFIKKMRDKEKFHFMNRKCVIQSISEKISQVNCFSIS